jgi:UDP-glucose 4-epimerase
MGVVVPPQYGPDRKAVEVVRRLADVTKAEARIDFKARVPLEEGLRRLVAWWSRETNTPLGGGRLTSSA